MITVENGLEDLILSIAKNCETLVDQTHRKAKETLELKMITLRQTHHFNPPIQPKRDWMVGIINLEVYNFIFKMTEEKNNFEHYTVDFDEFSFIKNSKMNLKSSRILQILHHIISNMKR